jgi:hypothetical protein
MKAGRRWDRNLSTGTSASKQHFPLLFKLVIVVATKHTRDNYDIFISSGILP